MEIKISMALISLICVLVIDVAGFVETIKPKIARLLNTKGNINLKPFDCSLCMTWWCCVAYLLFNSQFTLLNVAVALLFACATNITLVLYRTIENIIMKILEIINHLINSILCRHYYR